MPYAGGRTKGDLRGRSPLVNHPCPFARGTRLRSNKQRWMNTKVFVRLANRRGQRVIWLSLRLHIVKKRFGQICTQFCFFRRVCTRAHRCLSEAPRPSPPNEGAGVIHKRGPPPEVPFCAPARVGHKPVRSARTKKISQPYAKYRFPLPSHLRCVFGADRSNRQQTVRPYGTHSKH